MNSFVQMLGTISMTQFFVLSDSTRNVDLLLESEQSYDPVLLAAGKPDVSFPLKLKKSQGNYACDIIRLQDVFNRIASDNLISTLEAKGITGWKTYPVLTPELNGKYHGLIITGTAKEDRSEQTGFLTGKKIIESTWDGSDLFHPEGTFVTIITERAKEVLEKCDIRNMEITPVGTFKWYNAGG